MKVLPKVFLTTCIVAWLVACKKPADAPAEPGYTFSYPDSVLYMQNTPDDYVVKPVQQRSGRYAAYPEGIELDERTGAINVSKSETGLRYRITFTADDGSVYTTKVVISGINYTDNYFFLKANDTIVNPVYNADPAKALPVSGSVFDEGSLANGSGCAMGTVNGKINLAASIRQGLFGTPAQYGAVKEVETRYRLNDKSNKAANGLKVKFYYYRKTSDVPQYLLDLLNDRKDMFFRTMNTASAVAGSRLMQAKPRPPCIIVIAE